MVGATVDVRDGQDTTAWWFLDGLVVEHRVAAEMAGVVLETSLPVGHSPVLHVHETLDDTWYAIEGRMAARCGDEEFVVNAGDWVSVRQPDHLRQADRLPQRGATDVDPTTDRARPFGRR